MSPFSILFSFPKCFPPHLHVFRILPIPWNSAPWMFTYKPQFQDIDLFIKRQPDPLSGSQSTEREASDGVRKRKQEHPDEEKGQQKRWRVSKPLMETLWAQFKSRRPLELRDRIRLSFEFSLVDKQISKWLKKKEKQYKKFSKKRRHCCKHRHPRS
ncbi:NANOG neighbor homeobox isoform X2 [Dromiciops gliroides]|uniref:NANOG neighbor homeobox isoform X2 n=1 Tax=Dromiciops gliroides TaxID=33562 RepID=UPI001CC3F880|nr:NANOG neighbor homeobox isoform X2 [Dromiciops gliroides]